MQPLEGVTVVSLEQAVAAPLATRHLADLGARVIKVERPGTGDFARAYDRAVRGMSSHFVWLNRSKESLTLDLKRPEAKDVLRALLGKADVFVHNLAPGAVDRLGFGSAAVSAEHPRLIVCQVSGYGTSGSSRDRKAYDLLVQAETGVLSITGSPDAPAKVGIPVADIAAGMYAFSGILSALFARTRTQKGAVLEVSLFEALGEWVGFPLYYDTYNDKPLTRTGARHAAIAPYGPFAAGDGTVVYLAVQNEREWRRFCDVVLQQPEMAGDDRFASNSARVDHREQLESLVAERLQRLTGPELTARLEAAGIANAPMNTIRQFVAHPQLEARRRWREIDSPVGRLRALVPPVTIEGIEPVMHRIPEVGEDTERILRELNVDEGTIDSWRRQGIV